MGGMVGTTLSPYYAILVVSLFGLKGLPVIVIPGVFIGVALLWFLPVLGDIPDVAKKEFRGRGLSNIFRVFRKLFALWSISFLCNASTRSVIFFLPLLMASRGGTLLQGGTALFVISLTGTAAAVAGARVADQVGKRRFMGIMLFLGPIPLYAALHSQGALALGLYTLGYSLLSSTVPVTAASAIERSPESRSVASSLMIGVSWGFAGLITFPLGTLADAFSIEIAMQSGIFLSWFALPILLRHRLREVWASCNTRN